MPIGRPRSVSDEEILAAARRVFLEHGAAVPAAVIGQALGVSHTTLFNRFGSKEAMMIAALGPPRVLPWAAHLAAGPDDRPVRAQLVEMGAIMSDYFVDLAAGLAVLRGAGIGPARIRRSRGRGEPTPIQAFRALSQWLRRARAREMIGDVDIATLTSTIISALHHRAFAGQMGGVSGPGGSTRAWLIRFVDLLWGGIAP